MNFRFKQFALVFLIVCSIVECFSFELKPNYYSAYQHFVSGNREELVLENIPFSEFSSQLNEQDLIMESEVLSGLLIGDTSYFCMYGINVQHSDLEIFANNTRLKNSQIKLKKLSTNLQQVVIALSNVNLKAKQAVRFQISSQSSKTKLALHPLSNRIELFDLGIKNKAGKREIFIESNLVKAQELELKSDFGSQILHFKPGFQIQSIVLERAEFEKRIEFEWWSSSKKMFTESIDLEPISSHQIYLNILSDNILNTNLDLPYELLNPTKILVWDEEIIPKNINFSVHPDDINLTKKIATLDHFERTYKSALRRKNYPSRTDMNRYLDYGIEYLAWMPSDRNFYPESIQNQQHPAEFYEDGDRKLLIYKALNLRLITTKKVFRESILYHLKQLKTQHYKYKSSALMFKIETVHQAKALQTWMADWNSKYALTGLQFSHLADFFEAFKRQHFSSIPKTDQVQQARKLYTPNYNNPYPLKKIITDNQSCILTSGQIRFFNPNAKSFSGLIRFNHQQGEWKSAHLETGEQLPVQEMDKGEFWIYIPKIQGFSSIKVQLSTSKVKAKSESKIGLKVKKKGIVWKFGKQWLSKPNQSLFKPFVFNDLERKTLKLLSVKTNLNSGSGLFKTLTKNWMFSENLNLKTVDYIFNNQDVIIRRVYWENLPKSHSLHLALESVFPPKAYSLDLEFKTDLGYKRHHILNTFSSKASIFKFSDIKLQIESPQQLHWQYNYVNYKDLNLDSKEKIKYPTRFINYMKSDSIPYFEYKISLLETDEKLDNTQLKVFALDDDLKTIDFGFSLENADIQVVNVISIPDQNYTLLLLKNTSDEIQATKITIKRRKSKIYTALFSGKKTGIVKQKLTLNPKLTQLIRVQL